MKRHSLPVFVLVLFAILVCLCFLKRFPSTASAAVMPSSPTYASTFEQALPEGNYLVTITIETNGGISEACVKAEGRRLMFYSPVTGSDKGAFNDHPESQNPTHAEAGRVTAAAEPHQYVSSFAVNIRTTEIGKNAQGGRVSIRPREVNHPRWDDLLTVTDFTITADQPVPELLDGTNDAPVFHENGSMGKVGAEADKTARPDVSELAQRMKQTGLIRGCKYSIQVDPLPDAVTIYLAGDSTVCDQLDEPWATWGMMIPAFFSPGTSVANHAESGLALSSFVAQRRLDKILSTMKAGDYVMIQFGHNDQKETGPEAGADKGYSKRLAEFIDKVKAKGAHPVVVTPVERRRFRDGKPYGTLQDYATAAKKVAAEKDVPVIDLNTMSLKFYEALGEEGSKNAFVHYPANTFPNQPQALKDDTHHSPYGGFELAKCVVRGIKENVPELAERLRPDIPDFDPAKPDDFASFRLPASGKQSAQKPDGQ